jgi:hypothetical protein
MLKTRDNPEESNRRIVFISPERFVAGRPESPDHRPVVRHVGADKGIGMSRDTRAKALVMVERRPETKLPQR